MSIIDRAREALNRWKYGTPHESANAAIELTSSSAAYAAAVVRAAELADVWETRADSGEHSPAEQSAYRVAAQELRAALEGAEE